MLFRCEDLERYVVETSREKINLILINKADFLSEKQRQLWAEYFDGVNLPVAFFSALEENQSNQLRKLKMLEEEDEEVNEEEIEGEDGEQDEEEEDEEEDDEDEWEDEDEEDDSVHEGKSTAVENESASDKQITDKQITLTSTDRAKETKNDEPVEDKVDRLTLGSRTKNSTRLLTGAELVELFKTIHKGRKVQEGRSVVGLVGYPNVGKSSTINSLLTYKKVSVSATPGKTKHFQVRFNRYTSSNNFILISFLPLLDHKHR